MTRNRWFVAAFAATLLSLVLFVRYRTTPSLPAGIYLRNPFARAPQAGDIVEFCLPSAPTRWALHRGYLRPGSLLTSCPDGNEPLGKRVAALPGQFLEAGPLGHRLDPFGPWQDPPLRADSQGRPLSPFRHRGPLSGYWLVGDGPGSWDSRYWGPVPAANLRARLRHL